MRGAPQSGFAKLISRIIWHRTTISASREARDGNNPMRTDQISWSNSTMLENINQFDAARHWD